MLKTQFLVLCVSALTPFVIGSFSSSLLAQSQGPAGYTSGNTPTGSSQTPLSIPPVTSGGASTRNVTVTIDANGSPSTVTIPPAVATEVNNAGISTINEFSSGSPSQQKVSNLVTGTPAIVNNINGNVPDPIVVTTPLGTSTYPTFAAAKTALDGVSGNYSMTVGGVTVTVNQSN
ncbi:MAG: hypothetical protein ACKO4S_11770 [Snowella sp.]